MSALTSTECNVRFWPHLSWLVTGAEVLEVAVVTEAADKRGYGGGVPGRTHGPALASTQRLRGRGQASGGCGIRLAPSSLLTSAPSSCSRSSLTPASA